MVTLLLTALVVLVVLAAVGGPAIVRVAGRSRPTPHSQ
jgi:hypothetical protein